MICPRNTRKDAKLVERLSFRVFSRVSRAIILTIVAVIASCDNSPRSAPSNMSAAREAKAERKELREAIKKIEPFFKPMGESQPYDWLGAHNEAGQTFAEYLESGPVRPTAERATIYVLPLGVFDAKQRKVIDAAGDYLAVFYDLTVKELKARSIKVDDKNSRRNPYTGNRQIKTHHILADILMPALPADAAALIAFTSTDLYPDESMNFVFGQASLGNRVGVWSLNRLDDNTTEQNFLIRTLKVAAHETGHMFSMLHCTKYECVMSGTNHLAETDRRPIDACPECMAKITWFSDVDPAERYRKLAEICRSLGLTEEATEFERKAAAISKK